MSSATRMRVFTVPSGSSSRAAISVWVSPSKYASSMATRWISGSCCSACLTRTASRAASRASSGSAGGGGQLAPRVFGFQAGAIGPGTAGAQTIDRPRPCHVQQPRHDGAAGRVVARRLPPRLIEHLLDHLLGVRLVGDDAQGERIDGARVAIVQGGEGRAVASRGAGHASDVLVLLTAEAGERRNRRQPHHRAGIIPSLPPTSWSTAPTPPHPHLRIGASRMGDAPAAGRFLAGSWADRYLPAQAPPLPTGPIIPTAWEGQPCA